MEDKLKNVCTIKYFKTNLLGLTVSLLNTWRDHCLIEEIDGLSFDVNFMSYLALSVEGDSPLFIVLNNRTFLLLRI